QYAIMPLVGLGVALLLQLPPELAVGVILVGSAPGGTSSNVIAYLSKADTALSVTMTSISTLLAPLLTPLLTLWLAGSYLPGDAGAHPRRRRAGGATAAREARRQGPARSAVGERRRHLAGGHRGGQRLHRGDRLGRGDRAARRSAPQRPGLPDRLLGRPPAEAG